MEHHTITVTGRVQGVFFRRYAQAQAEELGLVGLARNEADGSVRVEIEGDEATIRVFIAWCHSGPPEAKVTGVDTRSGPIVGYQDFSIR